MSQPDTPRRKTLTFNDKVTLRQMMAEACEWQDHTNASSIEAAEVSERYENVLAKIVPKGPLTRRHMKGNR